MKISDNFAISSIIQIKPYSCNNMHDSILFCCVCVHGVKIV